MKLLPEDYQRWVWLDSTCDQKGMLLEELYQEFKERLRAEWIVEFEKENKK